MNNLMPKIPWQARDLLERVGSTFVQAFLATLVAGPFFLTPTVTAVEKAGLAGVTAVITLVFALVDRAKIDPTLPVLQQAILRVARTAAAAALGWLASVPLLDLDQLVDGSLWQGVWFALSTAGLAAIKAEITRHVGDGSVAAIVEPSPSEVLDTLIPSRSQLEHAGIAVVDVVFSDGSKSSVAVTQPPLFSTE